MISNCSIKAMSTLVMPMIFIADACVVNVHLIVLSLKMKMGWGCKVSLLFPFSEKTINEHHWMKKK